MDKLDVSGHFQSDLDEIAEMVTNLDVSDDLRTMMDKTRQIIAKLDQIVQTKANLEILEKAMLTGQI